MIVVLQCCHVVLMVNREVPNNITNIKLFNDVNTFDVKIPQSETGSKHIPGHFGRPRIYRPLQSYNSCRYEI